MSDQFFTDQNPCDILMYWLVRIGTLIISGFSSKEV